MSQSSNTGGALGFGEVYAVDFDRPGCIYPRCGNLAILESGSSHFCFTHWEDLRAKCELVRMMFERKRLLDGRS